MMVVNSIERTLPALACLLTGDRDGGAKYITAIRWTSVPPPVRHGCVFVFLRMTSLYGKSIQLCVCVCVSAAARDQDPPTTFQLQTRRPTIQRSPPLLSLRLLPHKGFFFKTENQRSSAKMLPGATAPPPRRRHQTQREKGASTKAG